MAKAKILLKTANYMTSVGLLGLLRIEFGDQLDISMAQSFDDLKQQMASERFSMLIVELKAVKGLAAKNQIQQLLKSHTPSRTLVICNNMDIDFCRWLYHLGVLGVVNAKVKLTAMQKAIANVYKGKRHIDNAMLLQLVHLPAVDELVAYN
jgi:DNA-binding NarL/FixJ family response regulator